MMRSSRGQVRGAGLKLATLVAWLAVTSLGAAAQSSAAPQIAGGPTPILILLTCGLMGLVGQGARVAVGLTTFAVYKLTTPASSEDAFNLARLTFSLIVGFIAGVLAGLAQWGASPVGLGSIALSDFSTVVHFGVAGYIGADVIEAFTTRFFEGGGTYSLPQGAASPGKPTSAQVSSQMADLSTQVADLRNVFTQGALAGLTANQDPGPPPGMAVGFDCEFYPGDEAVAWLRANGGFRVCVCYLANSPGKPNESWISKRGHLGANGWGMLPTYAGLQIHSTQAGKDTGSRDGGETVQLMQRAGFPVSSVVYLDLEDGTTPTGAYLSYIQEWVSAVKAGGFTPALYCSHLIAGWALSKAKLVQIVWSFHIPANTYGEVYSPGNLPAGAIDAGCVATQFRQKVNLVGLAIPSSVDADGLDLNVCVVPDPSNYASVVHALGL